MAMQSILVDIQHALKTIQEDTGTGNIADFKQQKQEGAKMMLTGAIQRLLEETKSNPEVHSLAQRLSTATTEEMSIHLDKVFNWSVEWFSYEGCLFAQRGY